MLWLTWEYISYASLCGVGLLFALTPLHIMMSKCYRYPHFVCANGSSLRQKTAGRTDERIKVGTGHLTSPLSLFLRFSWKRSQQTMNEVLQGMRVIKMYAWEKPFSQVQPT